MLTIPSVTEPSGLDMTIQGLSLYVADAGQGTVDLLKVGGSRARQGLTRAGQIIKLMVGDDIFKWKGKIITFWASDFQFFFEWPTFSSWSFKDLRNDFRCKSIWQLILKHNISASHSKFQKLSFPSGWFSQSSSSWLGDLQPLLEQHWAATSPCDLPPRQLHCVTTARIIEGDAGLYCPNRRPLALKILIFRKYKRWSCKDLHLEWSVVWFSVIFAFRQI